MGGRKIEREGGRKEDRGTEGEREGGRKEGRCITEEEGH